VDVLFLNKRIICARLKYNNYVIPQKMKIRFYETASGSRPVQKYLDKLTGDEVAKIFAAFLDIEKHGVSQTTVQLRQIDGKLWEIKVSQQRVFYILITGPEMVLLHAYKKQGQKAPLREIETATKRMREVISNLER
jgi:phage-related protein